MYSFNLSTDHLVKFALLGDSITLPCAKHAPSVRLCSSVNWNMAEQFQSVTEVVKAGRVTSPDRHRLVLLNDCSLQINHLMLNDARLYTCDSGTRNSSVSLQILESKWFVVASKLLFIVTYILLWRWVLMLHIQILYPWIPRIKHQIKHKHFKLITISQQSHCILLFFIHQLTRTNALLWKRSSFSVSLIHTKDMDLVTSQGYISSGVLRIVHQ